MNLVVVVVVMLTDLFGSNYCINVVRLCIDC